MAGQGGFCTEQDIKLWQDKEGSVQSRTLIMARQGGFCTDQEIKLWQDKEGSVQSRTLD